MATLVISEFAIPAPTARELRVLTLIAEGKCSKEIAVAMGIETSTAETHRVNLYRRMGFTSQIDVVHYALANNLVANKYAKDEYGEHERDISKVGKFLEVNLGRKLSLNDISEDLGVRDAAALIHEINRRQGTISVICEGPNYWAIER